MTEVTELGPGAAFKNEGNAHFKAGEHLKAAAAYTKAIKAEPANHVYYSNRSQAFLKLSKIAKAIEDADKCIELSPTFVKGYHRKASALAAMQDEAKKDEACEVLLAAIDLGLDSNDLVRLGLTIKGKAFVKLADARRKGEETADEGKENGAPAPTEAAAKKPKADTTLKTGGGAPGESGGTHLYELDPESFAGLMIKDVFKEVLEKKTVPTICYLQPGRPLPGTTEEPGLQGVGIEHAFASPSTLSNCADFLRNHISQNRSQSAMLVVRKNHVAYPCVWKDRPKDGKGAWPCSPKTDGIIMQLEARGARAVFFTELSGSKGNQAVGETHQLDAEEFGLFPRLFS
eukprot:CAMPEP_0174722100 /NCGR_PEP_ID=MMETSP1094-20130205/37615_1 /TAXON_ID=156173 /ORGANISM="Chrysochromulina brevifilum, Strain UTEX LB 985" /LENGTH=344 /DNA_ID=CAMNT_0015922891 /DNA_START=58 /DNA_END=1092 /DNA_ORIENTATION=-